MSHLKIEEAKKVPIKGAALTEGLQTRRPQFFTLSKLCLGALGTHVIEIEVQKLLKHIVLGQQEEAEAMISTNPTLLLERGATKDYSGRIIMGTAFQVALGAGDQPMWEMMLRFIEDLTPGEALRQFQEQFPNGIEDEEPSINYNAIATAIVQDVEDGADAIEAFRQEITAQKVITHGKHFNLRHLIAAYQAFVDTFKALGSALNNGDNRWLFWQQVIGYVQRQMTTYDAQIYCSGILSIVEDQSNFRRTLILQNRYFFSMEDYSALGFSGYFFPLKDSSALGFSFAVFSLWAHLGAWAMSAADGFKVDDLASVSLKNYVEQKQARLQDLESHLSKHALSVQLIESDNPNFLS